MLTKLALICIVLANAKTIKCRDVSPIFQQCLEIPEYGFYNNRLNDTIQCFRSHLITGIPELGIPSFTPLKSNISEINIDNPLLYTDVGLKNVEIIGLADFEVVSVSTMKTFYSPEPNQENIEYYFNNIIFEANYKGKANFFGLTAYTGRGRLVITLKGVKLKTTTIYQMQPPLVSGFHANVQVTNATVSVSGVQNDEDLSTLVSVALSRMVHYLFESFPERVSEIVNQMGIVVLNKLYDGVGYEDYHNAILTSSCRRKL